MFARQCRTKVAVAFAITFQSRRTKPGSVTAVGPTSTTAMLQSLGICDVARILD